jgi:acyl-CoA synthetase (AMP-forming)/AMP-acid ligase II
VTSWGDLRRQAEAFAAALASLGYGPGDCLGVQLPNWPEFCPVVLGAARLGVRPTLIHPPYRAYELEYILGLTEARGLVVPGRYRETDYVELASRVRARLPHLRDVIAARPTGGESLSLPDLLARHAGEPVRVPEPVPTDVFVLMFTSGTTSRPKGVIHLHANLLTACRAYVEAFRLGPADRWLIVTPFTHLTAFGIPFLTGALAAGGSVALLEAWDPESALDRIERHGITHLVGAPPMLIDLARRPDLSTRRLTSLRFLMYAGAPCPVDFLRRLQAQLGCGLAVFYGWTEGLAHTFTTPEDPLEVTSLTVGRVGAGWEWRVVDDAGGDVAPGGAGEFWGRGPNLSPGYYRQPEFLRERFRPDGWFMSGDIVTRNPDGTFTYVARKDDVINRGGQKIDPREVEELLYQHPRVAHVAVVAMPDDRLGQRSCAFVVPTPGAPLTLEDLRLFLAEKGLAQYKWPERLELVDSLPMTPTGKIMRYELRARASRLPAAEGPGR